MPLLTELALPRFGKLLLIPSTAVDPKGQKLQRKLSPPGLLVILTGLNLFNYLDRYILPSVLSPLMRELHISGGESGRINSAFMLGYFLTAPIFGYLGDRISRKWLIALGILIW